MPLSVGDGELRIVPTLEVGSLGAKEGPPVVFHWRWYYHFPTLPLWALILLLLIVPKTNRDRRACLILIPLVVVLLVWRMPFRLLSASDDTTETFGFFIVSGTMAWSMVWLSGHRLGGRRIGTFAAAFLLMLAAGLLSFYSYYGTGENALMMMIGYGFWIAVLLFGMTLTGRSCRKRFSRRRFFCWLAVWNCTAALGLIVAYFILLMVMTGGAMQFPITFVIMACNGTVLLAGILYLVNLPFLILAFKSPFYGERLERLFYVEREVREDLPVTEPPSP